MHTGSHVRAGCHKAGAGFNARLSDGSSLGFLPPTCSAASASTCSARCCASGWGNTSNVSSSLAAERVADDADDADAAERAAVRAAVRPSSTSDRTTTSARFRIENEGFRLKVRNVALKFRDFALQMRNFALQMRDFALQMRNFALKMRDFALK